jgi:glycosyltransferase involved in cell wall biosynthesis
MIDVAFDETVLLNESKLFEFLKYPLPSWYYRNYNLSRVCLYDEAFLKEHAVKGNLLADTQYLHPKAATADLIYQALSCGLIQKNPASNAQKTIDKIKTPEDNYRFLRKYFPAKWSFYTLFLRLLTLHDPISELSSFLKCRHVQKVNLQKGDDGFKDFREFAPPIEKASAFVSVIIPTLNRYAYLADVFKDLEKQTWKHFEVIVCDQSDPFDVKAYEGWNLDMKVIQQEEKALWKARNISIDASKGDLILLFDDDSRVEHDWIENHIKCLYYFDTAISAGVTDTIIGHGLSAKESFFHYSDVFDTGNALLKRSVFDAVGLFDRQFEKQRMGDGEFGMRAYLGGFPSISNPYASRVHLKVDTGGLRQFGSWDAFRPKNIFSPRPVPSVLYFSRKYFGTSSSIIMIMNSLASSVIPYKYKKNRMLKMISPMIMIILSPLLLVQVFRSWYLSGKKLEQGPIIRMPKKDHENITDQF